MSGNFKRKASRFRLGAAALLIGLAALLALSGCGGARRGNALGHSVAKSAENYLGVPYKYGGRDPKKGFDCSGLTWYTYKLHGFEIPRTSFEQSQSGQKVAKHKLQPGDLVFFKSSKWSRVDHVGIYLGGGQFIHAPRSGRHVERRALSDAYYQKSYHSGRRIVK